MNPDESASAHGCTADVINTWNTTDPTKLLVSQCLWSLQTNVVYFLSEFILSTVIQPQSPLRLKRLSRETWSFYCLTNTFIRVVLGSGWEFKTEASNLIFLLLWVLSSLTLKIERKSADPVPNEMSQIKVRTWSVCDEFGVIGCWNEHVTGRSAPPQITGSSSCKASVAFLLN